MIEVKYPRGFSVEFDAEKHKYAIRTHERGRFPVPSVTQVLGVLDKPAMAWWGMMTGAKGLREIALRTDAELNFADWLREADEDVLKAALVNHKLTVNHVRDKAGSRGSSVHTIVESYAKEGKLPTPAEIAPGEWGYVQAFQKFLVGTQPEFERAEVIVGYPFFGFAGTLDAHAVIDGQRWLLDFKTSKSVYESHHLQLAAYEGAAIYCGFPSSEVRAIVRLGADGEYEIARSQATFSDFIAVKRCYEAMESVKAGIKAQKKLDKTRLLAEQAA